MRTIHRYLAIAAVGGTVAISAYAEKVQLDDLPVELRDKIKAQTGGARIEDIDRQTKDGRTTYEVAFKQNGANTEYVFDDKGTLQNAPEKLDSRKVTIGELPPAVKRAVDSRLQGATANDIDRRVRNGVITYEVGFKNARQQQQEIIVSQDGRILSDADFSSSSTASTAVAAPQRNVSPNPIQLSSKEKVSFDSLPAAVKQSISVASKGARIEDVERGKWRARTVYEVAFKDQGRHVELQVEDNGRVLHDPRLASAVGLPATTATGAAASNPYSDVQNAVTLSSGQKVDRNALPAAVQQAISAQAPGVVIEDVERGTWRGTTVYEVAFKDQGRHVELQLDEKGNVVFDPRRK